MFIFHVGHILASITGKKNGCCVGRNCWCWRPIVVVMPHSLHFAGNISRKLYDIPKVGFLHAVTASGNICCLLYQLFLQWKKQSEKDLKVRFVKLNIIIPLCYVEIFYSPFCHFILKQCSFEKIHRSYEAVRNHKSTGNLHGRFCSLLKSNGFY